MSSGGRTGEAENLARARSGARAEESSDAREQVKSEAAWELHCRATADSAVYDRPGFVPDAYLDGLDTGTAVMAAELCSAGVWERAGGGYRILDRDAVSRCQDLARQLSSQAARVRARIRAREHAREQLMPEMARAMVVTPPCAACGAPATRIELVAPGQLPAQWEHWPRTVRDSFRRHRGPGQWYLIRDGVATSNGYGNPVQAGEAGRIARAFRPPLRYAQVATAGFYDDAGFCQDCDAPYCYRHWHVSETGYGHCPVGHGKSLDPHWQPEPGAAAAASLPAPE